MAVQAVLAQQTGIVKGNVTIDNELVPGANVFLKGNTACLLYTSPSPRD